MKAVLPRGSLATAVARLDILPVSALRLQESVKTVATMKTCGQSVPRAFDAGAVRRLAASQRTVLAQLKPSRPSRCSRKTRWLPSEEDVARLDEEAGCENDDENDDGQNSLI